MKLSDKTLERLGWAVTLLLPVLILMIAVRLTISPIFAKIEYRMPGFPEDTYGFSLQDRLKWSAPSIKYLVNFEGIDYLGAMKFEDGTPIYNASELSHMQDVKAVVTGMRIGMAISLLLAALFAVLCVRSGRKEILWTVLMRGGWALIGLIVTILLFVAISFDNLFTWFHKLFFESGTWQFYMSDTLIRLFPMRFWQDAFIFVGCLSLVLGGSVLILVKKLRE